MYSGSVVSKQCARCNITLLYEMTMLETKGWWTGSFRSGDPAGCSVSRTDRCTWHDRVTCVNAFSLLNKPSKVFSVWKYFSFSRLLVSDVWESIVRTFTNKITLFHQWILLGWHLRQAITISSTPFTVHHLQYYNLSIKIMQKANVVKYS